MVEKTLQWKLAFRKILSEKSSGIENDSVSVDEASNSECGVDPEIEKSSVSHELKIRSNEELTENEVGYKIKSRTLLSCKKSVNNSASKCNFSIKGKQPSNISIDENGEVPQWNRIFKDILGNSVSKHDASLPQMHVCPPQEHDTSSPQRHGVTIKSGKLSPKEKLSTLPVSKEKTEEEKVREFFELSRLFKLDGPTRCSLNEYEGSGVNVFNSCNKKVHTSVSRKSQCLVDANSLDNSYRRSSEPFQPYVHLTGFIAVRPYSKDDFEKSASIILNEVWDDDFF